MRRRVRYFVFHTVLHADDPPHRLALGLAIGMFITFTPTVGFQMILTAFFAWLLRANKVVGLPVVWISNPATIPPIFYLCYRVGRLVLQMEPVGVEWWATLSQPPATFSDRVSFYWERFTDIAAPLWVGSLIVALIVGYVTYYVSYYAIYGYRMKRWGQLLPPSAKSMNDKQGSAEA
jgi:uncharacterized protein (DUF2062 family)